MGKLSRHYIRGYLRGWQKVAASISWGPSPATAPSVNVRPRDEYGNYFRPYGSVLNLLKYITPTGANAPKPWTQGLPGYQQDEGKPKIGPRVGRTAGMPRSK